MDSTVKTSNQTRTINPKYGQKPGLAGKSHTDDEYQKKKKNLVIGILFFIFGAET
jgi:hypothetical protein